MTDRKWVEVKGHGKVRPTFVKRIVADLLRLGHNHSPSGLTHEICVAYCKANKIRFKVEILPYCHVLRLTKKPSL